MPVILEPQDFAAWLDCDDVSDRSAAGLLRPAAEDALSFFEIGPAVNKVSSDGPELQEPLARSLLI